MDTPRPSVVVPDPETWRHAVSLQHQSEIEADKAKAGAALATLKAAMLINGGAAVALLAFIGNIVAKESRALNVSIPGMRWALKLFVFGVFCAALGQGCRSLASHARANLLVLHANIAASDGEKREEAEAWAPRWEGIYIASILASGLLGVASLVAFLWGGLQAALSVW